MAWEAPVRRISLLLACLCALPAWSQSTSAGSVSGQVTDRQTAVIESAEVVVTDTSTKAAPATRCNEARRYIFLNVAPGTYNLSVSKTGFSQARLLAQTIQVGLLLTLNVTLEVGSTATTVEV